MTRILEIIDQLGKNVYLTKERWSHIQKHPEMTNATERIRETLEKPDRTETIDTTEKVIFYFKHYKSRKQYLFVSVKYLNGEGFIITSFYTDKIK